MPNTWFLYLFILIKFFTPFSLFPKVHGIRPLKWFIVLYSCNKSTWSLFLALGNVAGPGTIKMTRTQPCPLGAQVSRARRSCMWIIKKQRNGKGGRAREGLGSWRACCGGRCLGSGAGLTDKGAFELALKNQINQKNQWGFNFRKFCLPRAHKIWCRRGIFRTFTVWFWSHNIFYEIGVLMIQLFFNGIDWLK